jgi:hypothetical protein
MDRSGPVSPETWSVIRAALPPLQKLSPEQLHALEQCQADFELRRSPDAIKMALLVGEAVQGRYTVDTQSLETDTDGTLPFRP